MNKNNLQEIIKERDLYAINTIQWQELNALKNHTLAEIKPSTKEVILYFNEVDLKDIPEGFAPYSDELNKLIISLEPQYASRFTLEYASGVYRHPIPYVILRYKDKYFFILREGGSGETRLIGKKGLVGGHVGVEDDGIINGLFRELEEEVGVCGRNINLIQLKGLIKSNEGVDQDHLGFIYEIELNTDQIKAEEDGVLTGIWINKEDLHKHYDSFENWSKIVYDNLLKR